MNKNDKYIYIYKCIVGKNSNICKIGISENIDGRLEQHLRTPYYGFIPYVDFSSSKVIATKFKVKELSNADRIIDELFKDKQVGNIEIYSIEYDEAIEILYNKLKKEDLYEDIVKDGYSQYYFLSNQKEKEEINTQKTEFEKVRNVIIEKYKNNIPEEIMDMLKEEKYFEENCASHKKTGNYIEFIPGYILDLNYNKEKRIEILNKLNEFL